MAETAKSAALIMAHPGHELLLHHWLERRHPIVFALTDGSGGSGIPRTKHSKRLIRATRSEIGAVFGPHPDRWWYDCILRQDPAPCGRWYVRCLPLTTAEMKNILYCNLALAGRSGTEIVTTDTVFGLHGRGFNICLYVSIRGESSHALTDHIGYFDEVAAACASAGVGVDRLGPGAGIVVADLPQHLRRYDIVFATARMALEAMACGCAVVVVDARGLAGPVTRANVKDWRRHNFGRRLLTRAITASAISGELAQYDSTDASNVSSYIREHAALSTYLDALVEIYRGAIDEFARAPTDPRITLREAFAALRGILSKDNDATIHDLVQELVSSRTDLVSLRTELASLQAELVSLRTIQERFLNSTSWRITSPLRKLKTAFSRRRP